MRLRDNYIYNNANTYNRNLYRSIKTNQESNKTQPKKKYNACIQELVNAIFKENEVKETKGVIKKMYNLGIANSNEELVSVVLSVIRQLSKELRHKVIDEVINVNEFIDFIKSSKVLRTNRSHKQEFTTAEVQVLKNFEKNLRPYKNEDITSHWKENYMKRKNKSFDHLTGQLNEVNSNTILPTIRKANLPKLLVKKGRHRIKADTNIETLLTKNKNNLREQILKELLKELHKEIKEKISENRMNKNLKIKGKKASLLKNSSSNKVEYNGHTGIKQIIINTKKYIRYNKSCSKCLEST